MLINVPYNRTRAVEYAKKWALLRNPLFTDFTGRGGNCTNCVSQCIYAGCGVMNFTPTYGWYYISEEDRAPAWSGVDEFYDFIIGTPECSEANGGEGPYGAVATRREQIEIGDVIQLANSEGEFYHTLIVSGFDGGDILVCAHSDDALDRRLSTYNYASLRVLHIMGALIDIFSDVEYKALLDGVSLEGQE